MASCSSPESITFLELSCITVDSSIQPREALSQEKLVEYGKILSSGADLDPVDLFFDGSIYWLADGFHRLEVYRQTDKTYIPVNIRMGSRRDAILFGIERNVKHGLSLSLKDRKNAARQLLLDPEWSQWSNRKIGRICGLDHHTVERARTKLLLENLSGEIPQIQNFINTPEVNDLSEPSVESPKNLSGEIPQIQNFINTPDIQMSIRKAERSGREYTIDTSNIGRSSAHTNSFNPKDETVDITNTTTTVYDFLPSVSAQLPDTFRVFDVEYKSPVIVEDKLELSLKLLITGPAHALPLIVKQLIQTPEFAQFMFTQAQKLEAQANEFA